MKAPSFLSLSDSSIPMFVLEDLCFDSVFSKKLLDVFTCPCSPSQIGERQAFFRLLENDEYFGEICKFRSLLMELERIHTLFLRSEKSFSKYWLLIRLLQYYSEIYDALLAIKGCALTDRIVDYWMDSDHSDIMVNIRKDLVDAENILNRVSKFDIISENNFWLAHDYDSISYSDRLISFSERIGLSQEKENKSEVVPVEKISAAFSSLFSEELLFIEDMLERYGKLEFYALSSYIKELTFFLEVSMFYRKSEKYFAFCYPEISDKRRYTAIDACDLFLVYQQIESMVSNDIDFREDEPFWFLLGANGGGKTTFLRTVGSNLILFLCGCPVFAKRACIYPFKEIVSHFPKDERFTDTGRLDEEKSRVDIMLANGSNESFFLFNETFSGTDDQKGYNLAISTANTMIEKGMFGLFVTHFYDIENESFPILQAIVDTERNNRRTFKIYRRNMGTKSHAVDILKKYGLDRDSLAERRR